MGNSLTCFLLLEYNKRYDVLENSSFLPSSVPLVHFKAKITSNPFSEGLSKIKSFPALIFINVTIFMHNQDLQKILNDVTVYPNTHIFT